MIIESTDNKNYKYLKGFLNKKQRQKERIFLVEGIKVIEESLKETMPLYTVISTKIMENEDIKNIIEKLEEKNSKVLFISEKIFNSLSDTEHSQGIISYYRFLHSESINSLKDGRYLFLDDLKDPGNLGGIIRSAEAFNINGIILSKETVDIYNPKVIRSTMASIFRLPIYIISEKSEILQLKDKFKIISTSLEKSTSIFEYDFPESLVLIIGNEAHGVSEEVFSYSDDFIKIPMSSKINSLNANVAASICMYEMSKND